MIKKYLREKVIKFRKAGYSYSYIQKQTGVSKSTLSGWLSGMPYKPNQETLNKIIKARLLANEAQRSKKKKSITDARNLAVKDIGRFTKRDLFMLGIGIYIGEGSKTNDIIRITNSDLKIIKTAIIWFKKILNLQNSNFSIRIHLYPDNNQKEAMNYWSKVTGLPKDNFLSTWVDVRTDKKKKNYGKLPFGTVHMTVKGNGDKNLGSFLSRRISSWIDIVHEKAGVV